MPSVTDHPFLLLIVSLLAFWLAIWTGDLIRNRYGTLRDDRHEDFVFILGSTLTLLGLIIGFTFSMAAGRYNQRKDYEAEEANAIGAEYLRARLLPAADVDTAQVLLKNYLDRRIMQYKTVDEQQLHQIDAQTARLQVEMWSTVERPAQAQPTPVASLIVAGMNEVLNTEGYTQAAWRNRIPGTEWALLFTIALFCNLLIGYGARARSAFLFVILPVALSVSIFLIAEIDSPRGGAIRVHPQNLEILAESLHSH